MKIYFSVLAKLCFAMSLLFAGGSLCAQGGLKQPPINPDYAEWLSRQRDKGFAEFNDILPGQVRAGGPIPLPIIFPTIDGSVTQITAMVKAGLTAFSPRYDMREVAGLLNPVGNQNPYGACWAFAALTAMETNIMISEGVPLSLSPSHLAYFTYNSINGLPGYGNRSLESALNSGGNPFKATGIMSRGAQAGAPVLESSSPYPSAPSASAKSVAFIKSVPMLGNSNDTDNIKGLIQTYGAVSASVVFDTSSTYYNPAKYAFRRVGGGTVDHSIAIVGWDDDFPRGDFPTQPAANGAWIVRNSWGATWGEGGYFYMSYDSSLDMVSAFEATSDPEPSRKQYYYDKLGVVAYTGSGVNNSWHWMANIFWPTDDERITDVSFYTHSMNAEYNLTIVTTSGMVVGNPSAGTQAFGPVTGTLTTPGYQRITLPEPVLVSSGTRFAVIVGLREPNFGYSLTFTNGIPATPNVSYYSTSSNVHVTADWKDAATVHMNNVTGPANFAVRAFTTPADPAFVTITPESVDLVPGETCTFTANLVGMDSGDRIVWTISSSGGTIDGSTISPAGPTASKIYTAGAVPGNYSLRASSYNNINSKFVRATINIHAPVAVTPDDQTLHTGQSFTFVAVLAGGFGDQAVTWTTNGGSITDGGVYTAPSTPGTYTITATSVADISKSGSVTVNVIYPPIAVSVEPSSVYLSPGQTQTFVATVTGGSGNTDVTWTATGGSITAGGVYTAPFTSGTYTITATSVEDTSKSASATVNVTESISVTISPESINLSPGQTFTFSATVTGGSGNTELTWTATGGSITAEGVYTAPSTSGTYTITATSVEDTSKSASATVNVTESISVAISPESVNLSPGQTFTFSATVTGGSGNTDLTWTATGGSITTEGVYTAPSTSGTYTITATSVEDTSKSASATVVVLAGFIEFISPPKALFIKDKVEIQANVVGLENQAMAWSALLGSITADGQYTAPSEVVGFHQMETIVAESLQDPSVWAQLQIRINNETILTFDGNGPKTPQLLDLANALYSTDPADIAKYDLNGDGLIDEEDIIILFKRMGWVIN